MSKNFMKNYKIKRFGNTDDEMIKIFEKTEESMLVLSNQEVNYKTFYDLYRQYLNKLPNNNVTKYTKQLLDHNGIFIGLHDSKNTKISIFSRVLSTRDNKLSGIVLDKRELEIKNDGTTDNIDNCIYATYYSLIRNSIICNESKIKLDFEFHTMMISYIYYAILKTLGRINIYTKEQLDGLYLICSYLYLRQHLDLNHSSTLSRISKMFKGTLDDNTVSTYIQKFEVLSKYKFIKEIGKALIDIDIIIKDPNKLLIDLVQLYGKDYFYNLIGPLSFLTGVAVIGNYPTDLFNKPITINTKVQNKIEYICVELLKTITYSIDIFSKTIFKD